MSGPTWLYDLVLCLHLLGAFSLVSGTVVAGVAFQAARRHDSCAGIALLLRLARVGVVLVVAGAIFATGFGLWLVHLGHWGFATPWVDAAIGLLATVVILGSVGGQQPKHARKLATLLERQGEPPGPELRSILDNPVAAALNYLASTALLMIIVLMVVKPGSPHR